MFGKVVFAWEAILALPRAVIHRAILQHGEVHAALMASHISHPGEGLPAIFAPKGFCWPEGDKSWTLA